MEGSWASLQEFNKNYGPVLVLGGSVITALITWRGWFVQRDTSRKLEDQKKDISTFLESFKTELQHQTIDVQRRSENTLKHGELIRESLVKFAKIRIAFLDKCSEVQFGINMGVSTDPEAEFLKCKVDTFSQIEELIEITLPFILDSGVKMELSTWLNEMYDFASRYRAHLQSGCPPEQESELRLEANSLFERIHGGFSVQLNRELKLN